MRGAICGGAYIVSDECVNGTLAMIVNGLQIRVHPWQICKLFSIV